MTKDQKLKAAIETLLFYADTENYNLNTWPGKPIEKDCGKKAREVINAIAIRKRK